MNKNKLRNLVREEFYAIIERVAMPLESDGLAERETNTARGIKQAIKGQHFNAVQQNKLKNPDAKDSEASQEAERRGLTHKGWGRYADKSGQVVAKSVNGKLVDIEPEGGQSPAADKKVNIPGQGPSSVSAYKHNYPSPERRGLDTLLRDPDANTRKAAIARIPSQQPPAVEPTAAAPATPAIDIENVPDSFKQYQQKFPQAHATVKKLISKHPEKSPEELHQWIEKVRGKLRDSPDYRAVRYPKASRGSMANRGRGKKLDSLNANLSMAQAYLSALGTAQKYPEGFPKQ